MSGWKMHVSDVQTYKMQECAPHTAKGKLAQRKNKNRTHEDMGKGQRADRVLYCS